MDLFGRHLLLLRAPSKTALQRCSASSFTATGTTSQKAPTPRRLSESTSKVSPNRVPQCYKALDFKKKVAVCDRTGSFLYEDLLSRSLDLARAIHDILPRPNQPVAFLCPNQSSFLLTKWSIWLAGHTAVPLSAHWSEADLEHAVRDSNCRLIVAHDTLIDRVFEIASRAEKRLICLDRGWLENKSKNEEADETTTPNPTFVYDKALFEKQSESSALLLYGRERGTPKSASFTHAQLNAQALRLGAIWDLTDKSSVLHALPLDHPFSIVSCMMAPLSVGGKVVMHSQFDTVKIWSHLLGIPVNSSEPLPKINLFPALPSHYHQLLDRYRQLFTTKKTKNYVKATLKKRLRLMASTGGPLAKDFRKQWKTVSGHDILNIYSTMQTGSVLSAPLGSEDAHLMKSLPEIQTRVVKYSDGKPIVQDENCRSSSTRIGELLVQDPLISDRDWLSTGAQVKMSRGKFEVLN